jgi:hypothetical protein
VAAVVYLYDLGLRFTDEPMPNADMPYAVRRSEWLAHLDELGLPRPKWIEVAS